MRYTLNCLTFSVDNANGEISKSPKDEAARNVNWIENEDETFDEIGWRLNWDFHITLQFR